MKKLNKTVSLILTTILLISGFVACGSDDDDGGDNNGGGSSNKRQKLLTEYYLYTSGGDEIHRTINQYDDKGRKIYTEVYHYDKKSSVAKEFNYSGKESTWTTYLYNINTGLQSDQWEHHNTYSLDTADPNALMLEMSYTTLSGISSSLKVEYDDKRRITNMKQIAGNMLYEEQKEYEYTDKQYVSYIYTYDSNGTVISKQKEEAIFRDNSFYDNQLLEKVQTDLATGQVVQRWVKEYNNKGQLIDSKQYFKGVLAEHHYDFVYSADELEVNYHIGDYTVKEIYIQP